MMVNGITAANPIGDVAKRAINRTGSSSAHTKVKSGRSTTFMTTDPAALMKTPRGGLGTSGADSSGSTSSGMSGRAASADWRERHCRSILRIVRSSESFSTSTIGAGSRMSCKWRRTIPRAWVYTSWRAAAVL